jgi:hypothetical protein
MAASDVSKLAKPRGTDRRTADRRKVADPAYDGPERRVASRRTGVDRRAQ